MTFKPRKIPVTYADGLRWHDPAFHYQEKADGEWAEVPLPIMIGSTRLATIAEYIPPHKRGARPDTDGIEYIVHDLVAVDAQDIRFRLRRERWAALVEVFRHQTATLSALPGKRAAASIRLCHTGHGGEFLRQMCEGGFEGVCAHAWDSVYGAGFYAAKRMETFQCVITGIPGDTQSVEIGKFGRVPLRGNKLEKVRVGSIIKVEGMGLTAAGKIREPRLCQDTATSWLVRH